MDERKIFVFIVCLILYSLYYLNSWFQSDSVEEDIPEPVLELPIEIPETILDTPVSDKVKIKTKKKLIPLFVHNACSILEVFTKKPTVIKIKTTKPNEMDNNSSNTIAVIGITVFLVVLAINAVLDVLKVKEEERERRKLNPDGERRQSLAEFANKKQLRRESSRFGLQLFQIAESVVSTGEDKSNRRQSRPYTRGDSTNSYLADRKAQTDGSTPTETSEPRLVKRQSVAKLFGARPVPMVRRSSFPALPLNPDVQALMLGHRQPSFDSDDEDGKGRRVRIIRRY